MAEQGTVNASGKDSNSFVGANCYNCVNTLTIGHILMALKDDIYKLRSAGLSYAQIGAELGCAKSTVAYHLSEREKENSRERTRKRRRLNPALQKVENFQLVKPIYVAPPKKCSTAKDQRNKVTHFHTVGKHEHETQKFTFNDVVALFGENPSCYLTGRPINWEEPHTYTFDHIHPRSKGGDNTIMNLGVCVREANQIKSDLHLNELLDFCEEILRHHGRL